MPKPRPRKCQKECFGRASGLPHLHFFYTNADPMHSSGTFLKTLFRAGTFQRTLFGTFPGRGFGTCFSGRRIIAVVTTIAVYPPAQITTKKYRELFCVTLPRRFCSPKILAKRRLYLRIDRKNVSFKTTILKLRHLVTGVVC